MLSGLTKSKQMQITQSKSTGTRQPDRSQMNHDRQDYDYRKLQQQLHARLDQKFAERECDNKCTTKNDEQV